MGIGNWELGIGNWELGIGKKFRNVFGYDLNIKPAPGITWGLVTLTWGMPNTTLVVLLQRKAL
ncbi:MAG: hypothetical protein F6K47_34325 [Symploca sp. SIO2E6]|nr:hypothetical protein [Symploca sp. SIO2E6]